MTEKEKLALLNAALDTLDKIYTRWGRNVNEFPVGVYSAWFYVKNLVNSTQNNEKTV